MTGIIAVIMIFGIPLSAIIGGYYIKLQKMKMEHGSGSSPQLQRDVNELMAENEVIKERLRNLEEILLDEERKIDLELSDYEKEQIRLDQENKFKY